MSETFSTTAALRPLTMEELRFELPKPTVVPVIVEGVEVARFRSDADIVWYPEHGLVIDRNMFRFRLTP